MTDTRDKYLRPCDNSVTAIYSTKQQTCHGPPWRFEMHPKIQQFAHWPQETWVNTRESMRLFRASIKIVLRGFWFYWNEANLQRTDDPINWTASRRALKT